MAEREAESCRMRQRWTKKWSRTVLESWTARSEVTKSKMRRKAAKEEYQSAGSRRRSRRRLNVRSTSERIAHTEAGASIALSQGLGMHPTAKQLRRTHSVRRRCQGYVWITSSCREKMKRHRRIHCWSQSTRGPGRSMRGRSAAKVLARVTPWTGWWRI